MVDGIRDWGPRLIAPIAFFVAAIVLILLVQSALSSGGEQAAPQPPLQPAASGTSTNEGDTVDGATTTGGKEKKRYRVREGDLLETIAEEFDTSVERLIELNPGIDPQALTVGQRIRVR